MTTPAVLDLYDRAGNAYIAKDTSENTVQLGDVAADAFEPILKLGKWADAHLTMQFPYAAITGSVTVTEQDNAILWQKGNYGVKLYDIGGFKEGGKFEYEIILGRKPPTNSITLDIDTANFDFFYQPALTAEEIAAGDYMPDNVIGSYAVYHKAKRDNQYKTGKAFHIYRPEAIDATGKRVWGTIDINVIAKNMTLTVPQEFLNSATYPVIIDPTFGYESIGATAAYSGANAIYGCWYANGDSGNLSSISVYSQPIGADERKFAVYRKSDLALIDYSVGDTGSHAAAWETQNTVLDSSVTTDDYFIVVWTASSLFRIFRDTGGNACQYRVLTYTGTFPDPMGGTPATARLFSMYATYGVAATAKRRFSNIFNPFNNSGGY